MKKFVGILITLFIIMTFSGYTKQETPDVKIGIFADVRCNDKNMKILIERYISKELKSLDGVHLGLTSLGEIVLFAENLSITHYLHILAVEAERIGIGKTGEIAVSAAYTEIIDPASELAPVLQSRLSPKTYSDVSKDLAGKKWLLSLEVMRGHFLKLGHKRDLENICKKIVNNFDETTFHSSRKSR